MRWRLGLERGSVHAPNQLLDEKEATKSSLATDREKPFAMTAGMPTLRCSERTVPEFFG